MIFLKFIYILILLYFIKGRKRLFFSPQLFHQLTIPHTGSQNKEITYHLIKNVSNFKLNTTARTQYCINFVISKNTWRTENKYTETSQKQ